MCRRTLYNDQGCILLLQKKSGGADLENRSFNWAIFLKISNKYGPKWSGGAGAVKSNSSLHKKLYIRTRLLSVEYIDYREGRGPLSIVYILH